jgi:hypothetical protein
MVWWGWVVLVAIVLVVAAAVVFWMRGNRHRTLKRRFGPEYERTVQRTGDRSAAEAELERRAEVREQLDIRPLSAASYEAYGQRWKQVQATFVDRPDEAVDEAETLVGEVMRERGYPVDDFESSADLVSVDHPRLVQNYRAAHTICVRNRQRLASTDELRNALLHYRSLFDELLVTGDGNGVTGGRERAGHERRKR